MQATIKEDIVKHLLSSVFCVFLLLGCNAWAEDASQQDDKKVVDVRFGIGLSYTSGFQDVVNYYKDDYGISDDIMDVPVGLSFNTTVQIAHGNYIASMPGIGIGPAAFVLITGSYNEAYVDLPVTATYGIKFMPYASVGPYVRGGIAYHLAFGDRVVDRTAGYYLAGGLDILQKKRVNIGIEAAYDNSKVAFEHFEYPGFYSTSKDIKTGGFLVSIRAIF
jgi:hypothetical protein